MVFNKFDDLYVQNNTRVRPWFSTQHLLLIISLCSTVRQC